MKQLEFTEQEPSTAFEPARIRSCRSCPDDGDAHIEEAEQAYAQDKNIQTTWQCNEVFLTNGAPWACRIYKPTIDSLNDEMIDLYEWLKPTQFEINYRRHVVHKINTLITTLWPTAKCNLFGSVASNLFLPSSDIDISVHLEKNHSIAELSPLMRMAANAFKHSAHFDNITVLDKAYVPIIKLTDRETQFNVDISFNTVRAVPTVQWIDEMKALYPVLEPLVLVIKQFLVQRDLNQPFNGGLSSYALIVMVVHFLKRLPERFDNKPIAEARLGTLFLEFLKFYGCDFDYANMGLRIRNGQSEMVSKEELTESIHEFKHSAILCIEDPLDPENDIGRGAHNMMAVAKEFANAYQTLQEMAKYCECLSENQIRTYVGPLLKMVIAIQPRQIHERNFLRGFYVAHPAMMSPIDLPNVVPLPYIPLRPYRKFGPKPRKYTSSVLPELRAAYKKCKIFVRESTRVNSDKGLQNGLSYAPVLCTNVPSHQHNSNHQSLQPQPYAPAYWTMLPNCTLMPIQISPNPPFPMPSRVMSQTSNGIAHSQKEFKADFKEPSFSNQPYRKNFHNRSASFSSTRFPPRKASNFRTCRSPSSSSVPTNLVNSNGHSPAPDLNGVTASTSSADVVRTEIPSNSTGNVPYPTPIIASSPQPQPSPLMPGIETTTVTTLRPLQSQQPLYCQTSPALNPPYCTVPPIRHPMNGMTSPPLPTFVPMPPHVMCPPGMPQTPYFSMPYMPKNAESQPQVPQNDESYATVIMDVNNPPTSSSSSVSVTSEDSGVNGTLDSSNDADASGACTEENLSCGEDEETVVNNGNSLCVFNEEDEDDEPEELDLASDDLDDRIRPESSAQEHSHLRDLSTASLAPSNFELFVDPTGPDAFENSPEATTDQLADELTRTLVLNRQPVIEANEEPNQQQQRSASRSSQLSSVSYNEESTIIFV